MGVSGPTALRGAKPTFLSSTPVEEVTRVDQKGPDPGYLDPGTHRGDQTTAPMGTFDG